MELAGILVHHSASVSVVDKSESPFFNSLGKDVGDAIKAVMTFNELCN